MGQCEGGSGVERFLVQAYKSVIPGYHQNKEHWNTIILDGSMPEDVIKRMIAESYDLIAGKSEVSGRRKPAGGMKSKA